MCLGSCSMRNSRTSARHATWWVELDGAPPADAVMHLYSSAKCPGACHVAQLGCSHAKQANNADRPRSSVSGGCSAAGQRSCCRCVRQRKGSSSACDSQVLRKHGNATAYAFQLDGDYIVNNGWRLRAACIRLQKECRNRSVAHFGCRGIRVRMMPLEDGCAHRAPTPGPLCLLDPVACPLPARL